MVIRSWFAMTDSGRQSCLRLSERPTAACALRAVNTHAGVIDQDVLGGGARGSSSACFLNLVKTVSNPTPAEIATSTDDTNWILSVASTFVAAGSKTPYFPTYCGTKYAKPATKPAIPPSRRDVDGGVSSAPQIMDRMSAPMAPALMRPASVSTA